MRPFAAVLFLVLLVSGSGSGIASADDRATGDWGGLRSRLSAHGVDFEIDYAAESFLVDGANDISYLGNLDFAVSFDTEKLGWWHGGTGFAYFEDNHGYGISKANGLLMPVSNLDAQHFTQLSEIWLLQDLGTHVTFRLGKQDANRDFAAPRFSGNFVNSSYGVLPGSPLPSFPAPALGVAVLTQWTSWLGLRGGVYEGDPKLESFGKHAFDHDAGVFGIGALVLRHDLFGQHSAQASVGGWRHTGEDRSGVYGIYDVIWRLHQDDPADTRSIQVFVRGAWSTDTPGEIHEYIGGGITAHSFLGTNNTLGVGAGYAKTDTTDETFVELFYKWRPKAWFTVEPDAQVYDAAGGGHPVFIGLRLKLKL